MFFGLSALECYIVIVAVFAIVYLFTPRKNIWVPFVLITVLFTVLAYHLVPDPTDDLTIYYHHIDVFREQGRAGIDYALQENWFEWRTYKTSLYYFYFISRLPNNYYLSAVTIFLVYALGFDVIYKAAKRFEINKINLFLASMFFISTYWYYDTASGIRNGLAFAIAFSCSYYHLVERKNIVLCYLGYICAALMHSAGFMPVVLVLIALITMNSSGKIVNFILLFGLIGGGAVINYLADITDNSFIQSIAGRSESHGFSTELVGGTRFYVNITVLVLVILLLAYFSKYFLNSSHQPELKRLYKYMTVVISFSIGSIFSHLVFIRFARWILPLIGALLFMIGMEMQKEYENKYIEESFKNNIIPKQSFALKLRPMFYLIFTAYIAVHFWYSISGSSLVWLHF